VAYLNSRLHFITTVIFKLQNEQWITYHIASAMRFQNHNTCSYAFPSITLNTRHRTLICANFSLKSNNYICNIQMVLYIVLLPYATGTEHIRNNWYEQYNTNQNVLNRSSRTSSVGIVLHGLRPRSLVFSPPFKNKFHRSCKMTRTVLCQCPRESHKWISTLLLCNWTNIQLTCKKHTSHCRERGIINM
jgi:hypothetical protein